MKSAELAASVPADALDAVTAWVRDNGPLTVPLLRRAVRDAAILAALARLPGQYGIVGARFGVSADTVREIEKAAKKMSRTM